MEITIKEIRTKTVKLDTSKLLEYAQELNRRFELPDDAPVYLYDILQQANLDGDIDLPEPPDQWAVEDWDEPLSPEELKKLMEENDD